jgi:ribosomal-protein-alanine N-acetyltransferase
MSDAPPRLVTPRLIVMLPDESHAESLAAYHRENREHLKPWSPARGPDFFTAREQRRRIAMARAEHEADRSLRAVMLLAEPSGDQPAPIIGECNLSNFVRGAFQACHLGYSLDLRHEGRGLMTEALTALMAHAFGPLDLHRVMANYRPENARSARLLERLGFVKEGLARDYLLIDGAWRDHVLTSLVNTPRWP